MAARSCQRCIRSSKAGQSLSLGPDARHRKSVAALTRSTVASPDGPWALDGMALRPVGYRGHTGPLLRGSRRTHCRRGVFPGLGGMLDPAVLCVALV